uniref:Uncharacterized protein n=1 Tax=Candidatus Kentrum sp. LPFa TaxID=2126335 RepID=A0A450Y6M0_9GAMM|nr:MAG: hypothetical protein BECKLPF1236A_GA0070988_104652 [Candidatus Kentron sp. LPFa]VFK37174.1 MAG: hypothetical protein BECKLPF1236C_GA0070990_107831 [Candidatus Kentron sp. LPFa]
MRQRHLAGKKLFIDYCGSTVDVLDGATGEIRQAHVFVAVLVAYSNLFSMYDHLKVALISSRFVR